jgi:hypothetical protein
MFNGLAGTDAILSKDVQLNMSIAHDRNRDLVLIENPRAGLHNPVGEPGAVS